MPGTIPLALSTFTKHAHHRSLGIAGKLSLGSGNRPACGSVRQRRRIHLSFILVFSFAIQVIHLACQQNDCVVDIGSAHLINYLLHIFHSAKAGSMRLCLDTLYTLLSHTPIVKETLAKGGESKIFIDSADVTNLEFLRSVRQELSSCWTFSVTKRIWNCGSVRPNCWLG